MLDKVRLDLGDRPLLVTTAWSVWKDHSLFGVGGWGFRHLLSHYVPESKWDWVRTPGRANVHCDPLQFLVEFGAVGFGLMAAALAVLVSPLLRKQSAHNALFLMPAIGLLLVVVFSLIDLPFRCPAILFTWVVVLAALPKVSGRSQTSRPCSKNVERILSHAS